MNRLKIFAMGAIVTLFFTGTLLAMDPGNGSRMRVHPPANLISQFPYQEISEGERAGLLKMREEEKLARDVYLALYNKWQHQVFSHIAQAEQRHMDAVGGLLGKYGIADPIVGNTPGAFSDPHLNDLYQSLVAKGATSQENALLVGATIEDMDIYDLNELTAQTDNDDIDAVYQNLNKGSRNHLRAFTRLLNSYGISYKAQFLTQNELEEIISRRWE